MTLLSSQPQVTAAVLDDEKCAPLFPTCPMCHTPASLTQNAIDAGADWWCVTCGQRWDATRLSAVAAYAAWVVERAIIGSEDGERVAVSHSADRIAGPKDLRLDTLASAHRTICDNPALVSG